MAQNFEIGGNEDKSVFDLYRNLFPIFSYILRGAYKSDLKLDFIF
jgi:hypothetical protein